MNWEVVTIADRALHALPEAPWVAAGWIVTGMLGLGAFLSLTGMTLIYAERKIAAHMQCRLGPMRVGWHGTLQTIADGIKLLTKESIVPDRADKFLHLLAPLLVVLATLMALAVIPMSPTLQVADLNVGVIYIAAVSGLGVFGILLGGWSSHNKWSLLGAMRSGAQIISYEITVALALLVVVMFAGSLQLSAIVESQADGWWIWRAPVVGFVGAILFFIASVAEINRTPFDMPEGESELTGGYHTEYSGLRFGFFFLAEFVNIFVIAAFSVTLFLGGWMPFYIKGFENFNAVMSLIPPAVWFWAKSSVLIFIVIWIRWTFPRLRVDQLMRLEWKFLLPIGFANLVLGAILVVTELYFFP